jgi:hypothetical protein
MKKLTLMLSALCLLVISSCSKDTEINEEQAANPNFRVSSFTAKTQSGNSLVGNRATEFDVGTLGSPCYSTDLVAAQTQNAGDVSVYSDGNKMYIVYTTNENWTLQNTHLSVGNCAETIPTTGSGNPKVGQFEKTWTFVSYTNTNDVSDIIQVVYEFDKEGSEGVFGGVTAYDPWDKDTGYCFAAHAVVQGASNETAWAGSLAPASSDDISAIGVKSFDGNNWAMLVRGNYGDGCTAADTGGGGGDTE